MSIDELAGRSLAALAENLKPMPDPYGRAVARYRRSQRRKRAVLGVGVVAVSVLTAVALVPQTEGGPPVAEENSGWQNHLRWNQRLVDSPTRGVLGQDAAFVADFASQALENMRAGLYTRRWPVKEVKVVFLDDVGPKRVAFVAFVLTRPDPGTKWPHASAWFVADQGASARSLADAVRTVAIGDGLNPAETQVISANAGGPIYSIGVAPQGCAYETAPLPKADVWTAEPTGSYVVRLPETERPEWWRVVCDGVVRKEEAAPAGVYRDRLTADDITAALSQARGRVDRQHAVAHLPMVMKGYATLGKPSVLWGGQISGSEPEDNLSFDGKAIVAVVRAVRGGWVGMVQTGNTWGKEGGTGWAFEFAAGDDPFKPGTLLAIRLGDRTSNVLVLPPAGAVKVRVLDRQAKVVAEADVRDDAALVKVANRDQVRYEALDSSGTVVGQGELAGDAALGGTDRFGEP